MRTTVTLVAIVLLGACATSPKTHFYALNAVSGDGSAAPPPFRVQLAAVHLPPTLDRRQMVRMTGDNTVGISETDRWSAPLDEMVRNVLSQDLAARLPGGTVVLPDAPAPDGTRMVVVSMSEFGPDAGGTVRLTGSWAVVDAASNTVMDRDVRIDAGPAGTADASAGRMSRALGELAGRIASGLSERSSEDGVSLPERGSRARPPGVPRTSR